MSKTDELDAIKYKLSEQNKIKIIKLTVKEKLLRAKLAYLRGQRHE